MAIRPRVLFSQTAQAVAVLSSVPCIGFQFVPNPPSALVSTIAASLPVLMRCPALTKSRARTSDHRACAFSAVAMRSVPVTLAGDFLDLGGGVRRRGHRQMRVLRFALVNEDVHILVRDTAR